MADDGALGDGLVAQQHVFDLDAGDVVAGRDDHVVGAPLVEEVAVGVLQVGVAGVVPAALDVVGLARVAQVAAAGRALHREAPDRSGGNVVALVVDDARAVARHGGAGGAGPRVRLVGGDEDVEHLGGADAVDDLDAGRLFP